MFATVQEALRTLRQMFPLVKLPCDASAYKVLNGSLTHTRGFCFSDTAPNGKRVTQLQNPNDVSLNRLPQGGKAVFVQIAGQEDKYVTFRCPAEAHRALNEKYGKDFAPSLQSISLFLKQASKKGNTKGFIFYRTPPSGDCVPLGALGTPNQEDDTFSFEELPLLRFR